MTNEREWVWVIKESELNLVPGLADSPLVFGDEAVEAFWGLLSGAFFVDRDEAEKSPQYKQVIPYNVISCDGMFLTYQRSGGRESRLDAKHSIGIGGHINKDDAQTFWKRMVYHAALREIDEELVYVDGGKHFPASSVLHDKLRVRGILYDESDEVGRVHLGLILEAQVDLGDSQRLQMLSEGKNLRWLPLKELHRLRVLEGWSQIVVNALVAWQEAHGVSHSESSKTLKELSEE